MPEDTRKERLRQLVNGLDFPIHCMGCDEWICGGVEESGAFHEISDEQLDRLWTEIKEWLK